MPLSRRARAFTIVEALATVAAAGVTAGVLAVLLGAAPGQPGGARETARQLKDSAQIRGIIQAMMIWAQNNNDKYPLPSVIDKAGDTVKGPAASKDTTANIFSMLIFMGFIPTDLLISPAETNPSIKPMADYSFNLPKGAVKPDLALWDPAFSADFTGGKTGHVGYSHLQPCAKRLERWSNTFNAAEPVITNRGPEIKSVEYDGEKSATVHLANAKSNTLRIHGDGNAWSGHVAFNDAHVDFASKKIADGSTFTAETAPYYRTKDGAKRLDVWCYDEPDDGAGANNFLGIFTVAGATPAEFKAIWD